METRARYILVGAFTLLGLLAGLGFILWLAKVQIDRTYAQYDIVFDTVAGLGQASVVQYNGVDVGQVLTIALDRDNPSQVRVRIEVFASTPIRVDTMATLASQGVTGVAVVSLAGGSAESERLVAVPPADVPLIASQPSVIQGLITDAPDLLAEAILLMRDIRGFATPENSAAIAQILQNTQTATARIDSMATKTESVMTSVQETLARIDGALADAQGLAASAETVLTDAQGTFASVNAALADAQGIFVTADAVLVDVQTIIASANRVIVDDIPAIVQRLGTAIDDVGQTASALEEFSRNGLPQFGALGGEARGLVASIGALVSQIGSDPGRFLLGNQTPSYRN